MGNTVRGHYPLGWSPNSDDANAPEGALLRADNCVLDQLGVISVRRGSSKVNGSALGDSDVHSLYTTILSGSLHRMAGAGDAVYDNGSSIDSGFDGSEDIAFGSHRGQILFARGTRKRKYDGSTVRNWGIDMAGTFPSATPIDPPEGRVFSSGAQYPLLEDPATGMFGFYKVEAAAPNGVVLAGPNHYAPSDGNYNATGAVLMEMAATNRAVYEGFFGTPRDMSVYDLGRAGNDDDIISLYLWVSDPTALVGFSFQVDVNDGRFATDWYASPVVDAAVLTAGLSPGSGAPLPPITNARNSTGASVVTGPGRYVWGGVSLPTGGSGSGAPTDPSIDSSGWLKIQWRRGEFTRVGATPGFDWNCVRALRLVVDASDPSLQVKVDTIEIHGGAIVGRAAWVYQYVRNDSGYLAKSALSPACTPVLFAGQDASIVIPADAGRDSQVTEVWLFRQDQSMDTYMRVATAPVTDGSAITLTDSMVPRDALILNIPAELNNNPPPDDIIGIVAPHYDRTIVLACTGEIWPSRRLDPDAFCRDHVIALAGPDEIPYWIFKAHNTVYVGTSKDVYALEGTGAENPDGSIDFLLRPLSLDHRPINRAVTHEGSQVVFCSDDGWRAMDGQSTTSLTGDTSLLYRSQVRHGVSPVNLGSGRLRAALGGGQLFAITPEGDSASTSTVIYRYTFATQRWMRHVYEQSGGGGFRTIHREPDGTVVAGDNDGNVWALDAGDQDDGTNVAITLWTKRDDLGMPLQRKKLGDLTWKIDTGGNTANVEIYLEGATSPATDIDIVSNGLHVMPFDMGNPTSGSVIAAFRLIQFRLTGTFPAFHLYDIGLQFRERPPMTTGRLVLTQAGDPAMKILSGVILTLCTGGETRVVTVLVNGVADGQTFTVSTEEDEPKTVRLRFTNLIGRRAVDLSLAFNGEVEIDHWLPITRPRPIPTIGRVQDSIQGTPVMKIVSGYDIRCNTLGEAVTFVPYFDGVADAQTFTITTPNDEETYTKRLRFTNGIGRRAVDIGFSVNKEVEIDEWSAIARPRPMPTVGRVQDSLEGSPGIKWISGYVVRGNTLQTARVLTPYLDGVADAQTFTIQTTNNEEPESLTLRFEGAARRAINIGFSLDGEMEIDSWSAIVTHRQPLGVRVWDSGPILEGERELVWLRELLFKVIAGAPLTITPYFDGHAFTPVTMTPEAGLESILRVPVGRNYVGRQPRLVVTSDEVFYPYWVEVVRRTSGAPSQKGRVKTPFMLDANRGNR